MELSDIILTLVGILTAIIGGVVKSVMKDIKELEANINTCQMDLPKEYVLKVDYEHHQDKVEKKLDKIYDKIDKLVSNK